MDAIGKQIKSYCGRIGFADALPILPRSNRCGADGSQQAGNRVKISAGKPLPPFPSSFRDRAVRPRKPGFDASAHFYSFKGKAMKADVGKWTAIVLLSTLAAGCSSIRARTEILDHEWAVYPGVRQDVKEMGDIFGGERPAPGWLNGLVTSILIFDLPFSAVFDTFVLPYDIYRVRTPREPDASRGLSEGAPDRKPGEAGRRDNP